jgi:hypothetical protein
MNSSQDISACLAASRRSHTRAVVLLAAIWLAAALLTAAVAIVAHYAHREPPAVCGDLHAPAQEAAAIAARP